MKTLLLSILLLSSFSSQSWEVDDFTRRIDILKQKSTVIKNDLTSLNQKTNQLIIKGVEKLNLQNNFSCIKDQSRDVPEIYLAIKNEIGGLIIGVLEEWAIEKLNVYLSEKDIFSAIFFDPRPSFNLKGYVVGVDKLSHFFDQGYTMFRQGYLKPNWWQKLFLKHYPLPKDPLLSENLIMAFYINYLSEETFLGKRMSGVKSYADIAANFSGMLYWMNLINGKNPYIKCNQTTFKYQAKRELNWADYVNHSWDEGVNCAFYNGYPVEYPYNNSFKKMHTYSNLSLLGKSFYKNLALIYKNSYSLEPEFKLQSSCPIELEKCKSISSLNCAKYIVSPQCLTLFKDRINGRCVLKITL